MTRRLAVGAVRESHQKRGIGISLIQKTREKIGTQIDVGPVGRAKSRGLLSQDRFHETPECLDFNGSRTFRDRSLKVLVRERNGKRQDRTSAIQ
jgi:hypothetical protein